MKREQLSICKYANVHRFHSIYLKFITADIWVHLLPFLFSLQKEIALYTASKLSSEFCWFDIDGDINPLFKVLCELFLILSTNACAFAIHYVAF